LINLTLYTQINESRLSRLSFVGALEVTYVRFLVWNVYR